MFALTADDCAQAILGEVWADFFRNSSPEPQISSLPNTVGTCPTHSTALCLLQLMGFEVWVCGCHAGSVFASITKTMTSLDCGAYQSAWQVYPALIKPVGSCEPFTAVGYVATCDDV